jgi:hypothetical protein
MNNTLMRAARGMGMQTFAKIVCWGFASVFWCLGSFVAPGRAPGYLGRVYVLRQERDGIFCIM